jgi:cytoskeleton protein RodZ
VNEGVNLMPAPDVAQCAAPGARLAEARRAQNLTPADVARQLKLSVWQVDALEAGRYDQLPGPIFVRGFIRNYARLMKLDAGELLREGGGSLPQPMARREAPPSQDIPFPGERASRGPLYAGAAVVIVGTLAIYEFYWNEPEANVASPVVAGPPAAVAPRKNASAPVPAAVAASAERPVARDVRPAGGAAEPRAPGSVTPPAAVASVEAERLPREGEREVMLEFHDESWVEIRDRDERVIFSQLNRPGTQQRVHGLPPFSIVVGNAHGVRLTYEAQPVDLRSHTKIDVARLILQ